MAPLVGGTTRRDEARRSEACGLRHFASKKMVLQWEETMFLCNSNNVARGPNLSPKGEKSFFCVLYFNGRLALHTNIIVCFNVFFLDIFYLVLHYYKSYIIVNT